MLGDERLGGGVAVRYLQPADLLVPDLPDEECADGVSGRGPFAQILVEVRLPKALHCESVLRVKPLKELPRFGDFLFGGADGGVQRLSGAGYLAEAFEVVPAGEAFDWCLDIRCFGEVLDAGGQPLFERCKLAVSVRQHAVMDEHFPEVFH